MSAQVLIKSLQDCMASIEDDYNSRWGGEGRGGEGRGGEGDSGGACAQGLMCMLLPSSQSPFSKSS